MLICFSPIFVFILSAVACRFDLPANATTNMAKKTFYRVNESITVICKNGFELASKTEGNLTCQSNEKWDKAMPRCRGKENFNVHLMQLLI